MPQADLRVAQQGFADNIPIELSELWNGSVCAQTGPSADALATFIVEVTNDPAPNSTLGWLAIRLRDPTTAGLPDVASLVGASKTGWADVPGYAAARLRRTDAGNTNGLASFNHREG